MVFHPLWNHGFVEGGAAKLARMPRQAEAFQKYLREASQKDLEKVKDTGFFFDRRDMCGMDVYWKGL